jgi:hypothetical protein
MERSWIWAKRLGRIRVVQFALVAGLVFAVDRVRGNGDTIALSSAQLGALREAETARKGAPSVSAAAVDERAIEDEILYREGKKLGFDKDDAIVRQRVVQKTLYLAEELAGAAEPPTEADLRRFYEATRADWQKPSRTHFVHVFARDRARLEALAPEVEAKVARGEATSSLGEPSPLPPEAELDHARLAGTLGGDFAAQIDSLEIGRVSEPIRSALGWHLVRVLGRSPGGPASFEEARPSLALAYVVKRRQDAVAAFLARAFEKYDVTIDGARVAALAPSGRLALRPTASGED